MEKLEREITETIVPAIISELILEKKITEVCLLGSRKERK